MLTISAHTRAQAVTNAAETLGVPLPPEYFEQVADAEAFARQPKRPSARRRGCTAPSSTPSKPAATTTPTRGFNAWRSTRNSLRGTSWPTRAPAANS